MPRTSKSSRPSAGRQSTLSFNHKVTKAVPKSAKEAALHANVPASQEKVVKVKTEDVQDAASVKLEEESKPEIKVPAKVENPEEEIEEHEKEEEEEEEEEEKPQEVVKAEQVTRKQIEQYWGRVEAERISKRVHQDDLSTEEKVLRYFDVSSQYGPCIGITRLKRWQRAYKLGINPPIEVLAVLLQQDNKVSERAHMDEILNPRMSSTVE